MIKIALVDDHILLRNGLAAVIKAFGEFHVLFEADNGKQFIQLLQNHETPDIVLLDITMPEMDGFATAEWIKKNHPSIKVLVLSMMDDDTTIIRMLKAGAKGYILKDSKPQVLKNALQSIATTGFFYNELISDKLGKAHSTHIPMVSTAALSEKEIEFLKQCYSEKTYKQIAADMNISVRNAEALRSTLFEKLNTQSRIGLVMYALRNALVKM
jgi:DNA-binding NarL/FixJ family response regulator